MKTQILCKRKISSKHLLLFLLVITSSNLLGQEIQFNRFDPPEGIPMNGLITGITQDNKGYMWFAGPALYRYDGYELKIFYNNPADSTSLASNSLESICADKDGTIWIGTQGFGIDHYDPKTGIFTHYRHDPNDPKSITHNKITVLTIDSEGDLWIGTHGGLDRLDRKTGAFIHYRNDPSDPNSLSCDQVRSIYEDKSGTLWIGTGSPFYSDDSRPDEGGLNQMDKKSGKFNRYLHEPNNPNSLIDNRVCGILEDSHGTFWVGTAGDGLHTMDRTTGKFTRHQYDPSNPNKLSRPQLRPNSYDHIKFIVEDNAGYIWIGTVLAGLTRYHPISGELIRLGDLQNSKRVIPSSWAYYFSNDGIMWVSEWWGGNIYYHDPLQKDIPYISTGFQVHSIEDAGKDQLWLGTLEGLVLYDLKSGTSTNISKEKLSNYKFNDSWISSLSMSDPNTLWYSTVGAIVKLNTITYDYSYFEIRENDPESFSGFANTIMKDREGTYWVGTIGGLDYFDGTTDKFNHFYMNPDDDKSLSQNWVNTILEDVNLNLWIGNNKGGGINLFNKQNQTFKHYLLGASIYVLFEDSDHILWAGTDSGLFKYDKTLDKFKMYNDSESMIDIPSVRIKGIVEDNQKNLWLYTTFGVFKLNKFKNELGIYEKIQLNFGFDALEQSVAHKSPNGKISFGATDGFYHFSPDSISRNLSKPQISFSNFHINNEPVKSGSDSPIQTSINDANDIQLTHNQNNFSISFVGIHYSNSEANKHRFTLENYDKDWRKSGGENTAYYYNVPPGNYTFRVKATSSNGVWAEKSIDIAIAPPWWKTTWAYLLYGVLLIGMIYSIDRFQRKRLLIVEREKNRERELAQSKEIEKAYHQLKSTQTQLIHAEKMASLGELTAGIAHEIQNPLNFVNNFSEVSSELLEEMKEELDNGEIEEAQSIADDVIQNLEKINHHGKRADNIVKGMLQHSRNSDGKKISTDINTLCDEYLRLAYHGIRSKDKSFNAELKTDFDKNIGNINIVPQDVGRVLLNLITNAFYAVNEKKQSKEDDFQPIVNILTEQKDGNVIIKVKDNGNGISKEHIEKIFQPFFTTKPTGQGTGLGLSLSYDIIKAHGGELLVESEEGEGSVFIIKLPDLENS